MKFVFTGPESSGKTSISKAVAENFEAQWFPEFAREYLTKRQGSYDFDDIAKIGIKQEETRRLKEKAGIKIYDTEAIVLYIWSTFKYGKCSEKVEALMENQQFEHYFLCNPKDIPWEEDPLREHPQQREELFELYLSQLEKLKVDFTILEGPLENRVEKAMNIIEEITLAKGGFCF